MTRQSPRREGEEVETDRRIPQRGTTRSDLRGRASQALALGGAHRLKRGLEGPAALDLHHREGPAPKGEEVDLPLPRR